MTAWIKLFYKAASAETQVGSAHCVGVFIGHNLVMIKPDNEDKYFVHTVPYNCVQMRSLKIWLL